MRKQFSLILWTLAAILSIVVFVVLRFYAEPRLHPQKGVKIQRLDKEDVTVLPSGVGDNPLIQKSFHLTGEESALNWDFLDEDTLLVSETFPFDGRFSLTLNWGAKYSFDAYNGFLYLKRIYLNQDGDKIEKSTKIADALVDSIRDEISLSFDSVSLEGTDLESLLTERMDLFVENRLYEIQTYQISVGDTGILMENSRQNYDLFSSNFVFRTTLGEGDEKKSIAIKIQDDSLLINLDKDGENKIYAGILYSTEDKLSSKIYQIVGDKENRTVDLIPLGNFMAVLTESFSEDNYQLSLGNLEVQKATKDLDFIEGLILQSQKPLYEDLRWMNIN